MTEREEELRKIVGELQQELARLDPEDAESRNKVAELTAQLKQFSDKEESEELLSHALMSFEVSHPKITALIDRIMTMLSSMGI